MITYIKMFCSWLYLINVQVNDSQGKTLLNSRWYYSVNMYLKIFITKRGMWKCYNWFFTPTPLLWSLTPFFQAYRIIWNNFGQNHFFCLKSQKYFECLTKLGNQRRWSPSSRVFTAVPGMEYGVWSLHCRCCCGNWDGMKILSVPSSPNFAAVPTKSRPLPPLLRRKWSESKSDHSTDQLNLFTSDL